MAPSNVEISAEHRQTYLDDGVLCIRQAFDEDWIEFLRQGVDRNRGEPSERGRYWSRTDDGEITFFDNQSWTRIPEYEVFVRRSGLAGLAGEVMGCDRVNFYYDSVFTRTRGTQFRTPFHQDEPYWSVEGFDCSSVWMPLDAVTKRSSLEFVRGSHRWPQRFRQTNFGELSGDHRDDVDFGDDTDVVPFPDVEGNREDFDILSWAMEPGDLVIFNARIIHGGSGLLDPDRELRVFNTQWLGDDVRVCFRTTGMDPDHSDVMTAAGLRHGDRIGGELYPLLWERPPVPVGL